MEDQMENNYLSGGPWRVLGIGVRNVRFTGNVVMEEVFLPAAGAAIFRKSILRPFRASCGKIRHENGFSVPESIIWWVGSAV